MEKEQAAKYKYQKKKKPAKDQEHQSRDYFKNHTATLHKPTEIDFKILFYLSIFRESKGGGEREEEKHQIH